jgi:N-acylneuraminate cytidylyltransferase/CMP-N,N'-diacetyllegionaminic acid synthase
VAQYFRVVVRRSVAAQGEKMTGKLSILTIVPAKARSTRIPGKNLKPLLGKPMLGYILEAAKRVRTIDRIIVTTDSREIKAVAESFGAEVPFIRPSSLCEDHIPTLDVIQHALGWLEENEKYVADYVLLLYPTSPLLRSERIDEAIELAIRKNSDSVISGCYDKGHYWTKSEGAWKRLYPTTLMNSQYQAPLFVENGAIYLTKSSVMKHQIVADTADVVIMDPDENIDVDHPEDFARVERILALGQMKK